MTKTKHILWQHASTRFIVELESLINERIKERYNLECLQNIDLILWQGKEVNRVLYKKATTYFDDKDVHMPNEVFFEIIEDKLKHDESYIGFMLRQYQFRTLFLEDFDKVLANYNQLPVQMLLVTTHKEEEIEFLLEQEKIIPYGEELGISPEEMVYNDFTQNQALIAPFKTYYQKHNRYHEVNISGKTEDEIFEEICGVIDGIGQG